MSMKDLAVYRITATINPDGEVICRAFRIDSSGEIISELGEKKITL